MLPARASVMARRETRVKLDDDEAPDLDVAAQLALAQEPQRMKAREVGKRPDVTLHQLRIFWAVAHSETLTKAAKQLGLAQPSLSQQLSKLESTLGSKLFHRRFGHAGQRRIELFGCSASAGLDLDGRRRKQRQIDHGRRHTFEGPGKHGLDFQM